MSFEINKFRRQYFKAAHANFLDEMQLRERTKIHDCAIRLGISFEAAVKIWAEVLNDYADDKRRESEVKV